MDKERFGWLKARLRRWLFPEYDRVCTFMLELDAAKREVVLVGGKTTFQDPVIFIGSLENCSVDIKPTLKPEIILSKLEFEAALKISGNHHMVTNSLFKEYPVSKKLKR